MNYRKLPKTDLNISEISFGCMSLDLNSVNNESILRTAHERGINYFDTADLYNKGANELLVGDSLKPIRTDVILATKVGNEWLPDGSSWRWNTSKDYILNAADKSLKRLQTDYIDIYQLHGGTIDDNRDEIIEAFELLKEQGKIRYYGISSIRPNVINAYATETDIVSDMLQYSLLDRRPEENVLELAKEHQIGLMVRGALAKGLLAGKPATGFLNHSTDDVRKINSTLEKLSSAQRNKGQSAIQYVLHHQAVTTAVIGFRTLEQLDNLVNDNLNPSLSTQEYQELQNCLQPAIYEQHRI
ncbi:aldo/keto reductase [Marinoscillum pacificum]|uniref:aldo/keto reductase n=1 Tax=Marinoscillum pacificum TaxID=392723 RepID=UPI0021585C0C|nr:aldo/keto reductase [Marinoscillum pacificum]